MRCCNTGIGLRHALLSLPEEIARLGQSTAAWRSILGYLTIAEQDASGLAMPRPLTTTLAAILLFASTLNPAQGQDFSLGLAAAQQGNYLMALQIWHPLAEAGDPHAQFGMGTLFHEGLGVEADMTESAYWFHRASEQGMAEAQYNLANAYKHGEGVRQSDRMAVHWWQKSAEQGFAPAQFNLGTSLLHGRGVAKNPERARYWYRLAADQGHPMAQEALAKAIAGTPTGASITTPVPGTPDCDAWLASQPAGAYSIQFMSSPDRTDAAAYIARQTLPGPFLICSYPREGTTWHAVLWGSHADIATARAAVAGLPAALQAEKPWIRSLRSLRQARVGK